jgi:phosphatidylinositol alpha-1,6-mannosyltransferase
MTVPPDLLLTFDFPPIGGGIARWMSEMTRRYPPGELIVSTGSIDGSEVTDAGFPNRVDRIAVPSRRLRTLQGLVQWSRRVSALVAEHRPGFIWCGNLRPAAYPAKWAHDRSGIPYGVIVHGGDLLALQANYRASRIKRLAARALLGSADVLVATSRFTSALLAEVLGDLGLGEHRARVHAVPLGTDPGSFRPGGDPAPFRSAHGLPDARWLLTVARLVPHKGIDTAIRALRMLAAEFPDLHYAVVGQGSGLAPLRALSAEQGVAERVHFLTTVADAELPLAYALASVYVGVSRQTARDVEGFGISLLEAQACGKVVVAGLSGGMADAVADGTAGLLVDPEDPSQVAAAVAALLRDPDRAARMGRAGRAAIERFYNWDRVVADLRALSARARSGPR